MTAAPLLPLMPSGVLPPVAALLRWLEDLRTDRVDTVVATQLPPLNGGLPDVLRLGLISTLLVNRQQSPCFRWEGLGGNRVTVAEVPPAADDLVEDFHHGDLPFLEPVAAEEANLYGLLELARLEDASSCLGMGAGASWHQVLAALDRTRTPHLPPLVTRNAVGLGFGAWNPLPFARQTLVALPADTKPWALRDHQGRLAPAQIAGDQILVSLPLQALEAVHLEAHDEPVPDAAWEVSPTVLDNGVVRGEFDALGQLTRLCWNGIFAELAGPAVAPRCDGRPVGGTAVVTVEESGPVRGRLVVVRTTPQGAIRITYTLHAHEDGLRINVAWNGAGTLTIEHPTAHRGSLLHVAGELCRSTIPQARSLTHPAGNVLGSVRWATLGDAAGRGLALIGQRPLLLSSEGGLLRIHGASSYALHAARRGADELNLGQLALALAVDGRSTALEAPVAAPFRLAGLGGLVPLWARRPTDWAGEVIFADQAEARGKAWLYPTTTVREAWRVDAAGNPLTQVKLTREADGLELEHLPGELFIVRWR
jgi:hypothetical protein